MIQFISNLLSGQTDKLPEKFFFALLLSIVPLAFWIYPGFLGRYAHIFRSCIQGYIGFLGVSSLIMSLSYFRQLRTIADMPTSQIRSAAQGFVKLEGQTAAHSQGLLKSPFTQADCVWYHVMVEQYIKQGTDAYWRKVEEQISDRAFLLKDTHDECLLHPQGAKILRAKSLSWYGNTQQPSRAPLPRFLRTLQRGPFRYTETYLSDSNPLIAMGQFSSTQHSGNMTHHLSNKGLVKHQAYLFFGCSEATLLQLFKIKSGFYALLFMGLGYFSFTFREIHQLYWGAISRFLS